MKKTDWPIRWDLLLRYRLIEIIALWEGRLTTNHICHGFGIGRQQASKDINTYLRELAPGNLVYDRHLKGYVPSASFRPVVTKGLPGEYIDLLSRYDALSQTFESLDISLPNSTMINAPCCSADPAVVRAIIAATRQNRQLDADYVSLIRPEPTPVTIEPHTLVCSGQRWHVRAWCEQRQGFHDFALSRFRGTPEVSSERSRHTSSQDDDWNRMVTVELRPDQRLSQSQRAIIAADFGMKDQRLILDSRAALVEYLLALMGIPPRESRGDPMVHQLELANRENLSPWLPARNTPAVEVAGLH
ncbi:MULTISPECIES: helix-turn-helix transcriptional regulator [Marinobacter]|uniref:Uncharacterized protein n=1 Tax=Marinobacter profundi TaxID=2666256 RepID=A0A2G1ULD4_9GAMM|nr:MULTISPECIES: WYL domain-containing protein [Marinobacter]MBD3658469.1 WYL domain-containing protein [Marinobacter sp.]PHQ15255.1 hypothetical protein CLH61_08960 [Marinobacter profundi]